jgi:fucose permease
MFALPLWLACRFLQARLVPVAAALVSTSTHRRWFNLPTRPLMILGLIGFCGAIVEGGIADWSGVFMQDKLNATDGLAPLGYAGFAGAMLIARLYADRLKDHFGARRVVAFGAMFAVAGMMAAVSAVSSPLTIAGFALAGAGLSGVFPFVFSAAGRHGSKALAGVATISYCGGLIGPPVIGFIGQLTDLSIALGCVGLLCALLGCVAYRCASLA